MKQGITLLVLVFTIAIMAIVLGSTAVIGVNNIKDAQYEQFIDEFEMVNNNVNLYITQNTSLPTKGEVVVASTLGNAFVNSVTRNHDEQNKLFLVNMQMLKNTLLRQGYGTIENGDVFLVAENSNNVYYVKGTHHKGNFIYSLRDILTYEK